MCGRFTQAYSWAEVHAFLDLVGPARNLRQRYNIEIENGVLLLIEARAVIAAFRAMIRKKAEAELDAWIERARSGLVTSFSNGVAKDRDAIRAAIVSAWSNGQTEGQITKLKLVKRQMYGRAKIDLLEARLIGAN